MVPIGMLIGVRDRVCGRDILEKGLPKWEPFYKLHQIHSIRDEPELLGIILPTGECHFHSANVTIAALTGIDSFITVRESSMKCPFCGGTESRVKDSRDVGDAIHRRRECEQCKGRFSTYERVEKSVLMVIKRDQRREAFDRQKLFVGISKACEKRPLSVDEIENAVEEIEQELYRQGKQEVQSSVIGELVMERLRQMDKIAYIRFASVYRSFNDVETMLEELQDLLYRKKAEPSGQLQAPTYDTGSEA